MSTTTPADICTDSLRAIGAIADGEPAPPSKLNFAFDMLNDMLDSLSNSRMFLFCQQEVIHELTPGQYIYTIGPGGSVGASFTGTIAGNVLTVTALNSGALSVGDTISATVSTAGPVTGYDATPGFGYTSLPTLAVVGDGSGATALPYLIAAAMSTNGSGSGYKAGQLLTMVEGTFTVPATYRIATISGSAPLTLIRESGGQYSVIPTGTVTFTGGTGTGFSGNAPDFGVGANPGNPGVGYTFATVTVTGGGGATAAVAAIIGGSAALSGTTITSYGTATGGNGLGALGTYKLNLSQVGGTASMTSSHPRPLRINTGTFVRVSSTAGFLDYPVDVLNVAQYERIGLKQLNGPWPRGVYYQSSMPLGVISYWPNPSQGEMHLMCDMLLNQFATTTDTITLPPGYKMALRWMLAELLMPHFPATAAGAEMRQMIPAFAAQSVAVLKRTNMQPMDEAQFDPILNSSRQNDAGWILSGGFGR